MSRGHRGLGLGPLSWQWRGRNKAHRYVLGSFRSRTPWEALAVRDGAKGMWRFNDPLGSATFRDWLNDQTGSIVGGAGNAAFNQTGLMPSEPEDTAVDFTGDGGIVVVNPAFHILNDFFSFEVIIARNSTGGTAGVEEVVFDNGSTGISLILHAITARRLAVVHSGTAFIADSKYDWNNTNPHHIIYTKNGAANHLYIDGVDVIGTVTNATLTPPNDFLHFGRDHSVGGLLDARYANAAVYPGVELTQAQVTEHFSATGLPPQIIHDPIDVAIWSVYRKAEVEDWAVNAPVSGFDPTIYVPDWDLLDPVIRYPWVRDGQADDWVEATPAEILQWVTAQPIEQIPLWPWTRWFAQDEDQAIQFTSSPYADLFSTEPAWTWKGYRNEFEKEWHPSVDQSAFQCDAFQEDAFQLDACEQIRAAAAQILDDPRLPPRWVFGPDDDQAIQPPSTGFDPSPYASSFDPIDALSWDHNDLGPDDDQSVQNVVQTPFDPPDAQPLQWWNAKPELVLWPENIPANLDQLAGASQFEAIPPQRPPYLLADSDDWAENIPDDLDRLAAASRPPIDASPWKWGNLGPDDDQSIQNVVQTPFDAPEQILLWKFNPYGPDDDQAIQPPAGQVFDPAPYAGAWVESFPPQKPAWTLGEVVHPDRLPDDLDRIASAAQDNTQPRLWSLPQVGPDDDQGIQPPAAAGFDPSPYASAFDPQAAQLFRAWTSGEVTDWPTNIPADLDRLASSSQPELLTWAWSRYRVAHDDEQPVIPILPEFVQNASEFVDPYTWPKWVTDLPPDHAPFYNGLERFLAAFELSEAYPWTKWVTDLPPDEVFKFVAVFDASPYAALFGIDERRLWPLWLSQPEVEPWAVNMEENLPDADETRWISARANWGTTRENRQTLHSGFGVTRERKQTLQSGYGTVRRDEADT